MNAVDDEYLAANRTNWDERTAIHLKSAFYNVEGWLREERGPKPDEAAALGDVAGLRLAHPQCHIGLETLSWARAGALVTGLDFSPSAILSARELAKRAGLDQQATFVEGNVDDAAKLLGREAFDIVYVSLGSLYWLPSVDRWAEQVAMLLVPGGRLYLHECHPFAVSMLYEEPETNSIYFEEVEPHVSNSDTSYTDGEDRIAHQRTYQWNHGIGEIVTAVLDHGLQLRSLVEHDWTTWQHFPWLAKTTEGRWTIPPGKPRIPLSFTLLATKSPG